jgi:hypothetical protein
MTEKATEIHTLVETRESENGPFSLQAAISQRLKDCMRQAKAWERLTPQSREALDMIQHKVARILAGNEGNRDHWDDIGGYARLPMKDKRP